MQCSRCRTDNPADARFCEECGATLEFACPTCGKPVGSGKKFCRSCGAALATEPGRFASPKAYTPKHLAEKILTSRAVLEGERKQVTVLFADMKGSMELLADRDPEEARMLLDPVIERMMDAVHRYEGTVNQVMGDGVMALFGAPLAHEDHAIRACYAALRLQEAIRRYSEELRRGHGVEVQIRVGLNSGEVVVRSIGSDLHMDYTAVGQTTHLAARLEQLATPGSIRLSAETLRLAEGYVEVKPLGPVPIKGFPGPVEVYELSGAGVARTRLQAAAVRGLTRFVGRERELETLRQTLERAAQGHGQVVAAVGEPGVGKSRLFWEFTHSHRTHGWLILESGSVSYGKATPYLPVIDLLKAYFQIEPRDDGRKIREKVTGKLLTLDRALEPILPALLGILDVPLEDPQWEGLDPPQRRQRTLDGVKRLLLRESQVQPLLLVFEDLHWIDSETQAFLDSLLESLPTARLLLLVNYRPEYQHPWGSKTYYAQLRLDPLPPENAEELLRALLGTDPSVSPLKPLLIERTEGNPFFLEESVRTLVETQVLVGERGAHRLAKAVPTIQVPPTVQAVLAARIDRLAPEAKRLLQSAAVVGEDVPFSLLQAIVDLAEDELRRGLADLQAAEFLYEARLFPELDYTFKHGLTYQVAYGSLLQEQRRGLHARIVEAIEALYPERLTQVERLAHHALRGEVWEKAVAYLRQAGAKAAARSAHREAVTCFEQALAALPRLPETRERLETAIDLRFDLRTSLIPLGEIERGLQCLREAEGPARTLDDPRRLGWASAMMASHLWLTGRATDARTFAENAQAIAETLEDPSLRVLASQYLGTACFSSGEYRRAADCFRRSTESLAGELSRERFGQAVLPAVFSRAYWAIALADVGVFDEAIAQAQDAVRMAEALDHPASLINGYRALGYVHAAKGELNRAISPLERALALCRDWNVRVWSPSCMGFLGHAYVLSGRVAEGLSSLVHALDAFDPRGSQVFHSLVVVQLGEGCILAGQLQQAHTHATHALTLARERGERGYEAWALRLLGEVHSHETPPDPDRAEACYRQAMALADELGMRPLLAHCHLGLGKLYQSAARQESARQPLTTAATMFREMDMAFWRAQAEAALREAG